MGAISQAFANRRMAIVVLLGFSSGLPIALTASTLQAWLKYSQVDLTVIGLFSLVGIPYTLKFLWAFLMDKYVPPFLGRRRGWLIMAQLALVASIGVMALSSPASSLTAFAVLAILVAFISASQDIVIDAYRTEILHKEEWGIGAGLNTLGYRTAMLTSNAGALVIADHFGFRAAYLVMAAMLSCGAIVTLLAPEPAMSKPLKGWREAITMPLVEFLKRTGALEVLLFLVVYKLDAALTVALMTPFVLGLGFTLSEVASVTKVFGLFSTITGTLVGGGAVVKLGIERSLWVFGIVQAVAGLSFMVLAKVGHHYPALIAAIAIENFCSGMGNAAFSAFMMQLCDRRFTASQYALITSFMALSRYLAGAPSGYLVKALGWEKYYLVCALAGIPGLLLLTRYKKWAFPEENR